MREDGDVANLAHRVDVAEGEVEKRILIDPKITAITNKEIIIIIIIIMMERGINRMEEHLIIIKIMVGILIARVARWDGGINLGKVAKFKALPQITTDKWEGKSPLKVIRGRLLIIIRRKTTPTPSNKTCNKWDLVIATNTAIRCHHKRNTMQLGEVRITIIRVIIRWDT